MVNQEMLGWIRQQLERGASKEQIKAALLQSGWKEQDIEEAFRLITEGAGATSPLSSQKITKLPGAFTLLGEAWDLWTKRLGTFLGVLLVPMVILGGVVGLLAGGVYGLSSMLSSSLLMGGVITLVGIALVCLIVIIISQVWGTVALLYAVKDSEEQIGVRESYRRAWGKLLSYWWLLLLSGFITLGGFLLFIIPGIIVSVSFSLAIMVLVSENLTGMNALLRSREYVKGVWLGIFWRVLVIVIVSVLCSFGISYLLSLPKVFLLNVLANILTGLLVTPFTVVYMFLLYRNARALKGETSFNPTRRSRVGLILLGIMGLILIPGILIGMTFLSLNTARERGQTAQRDAIRSSDITKIYVALEMYWDEHRKYPVSLEDLAEKMPVDPGTQKPYQYRQLEQGNSFELCAETERSGKKCFP